MLELQQFSKSFKDKVIFKKTNFQALEGELTVVFGKSGIGKSTLLDMIAGLTPFDDGHYSFLGKSLDQSNDRIMSAFRSQTIGYIVQDFALMDDYTIKENLWLPSYYQANHDKEAVAKRIDDLVQRFGLTDLLDKKVKLISGGQKQRVAIIRSMVLNPKLILADEPTANLDDENFEIVMQLFQEAKAAGNIVIVSTHDSRIKAVADSSYQLENFQLVRIE